MAQPCGKPFSTKARRRGAHRVLHESYAADASVPRAMSLRFVPVFAPVLCARSATLHVAPQRFAGGRSLILRRHHTDRQPRKAWMLFRKFD